MIFFFFSDAILDISSLNSIHTYKSAIVMPALWDIGAHTRAHADKGCYRRSWIPQIQMLKPNPPSVTVFGGRPFKKVIKKK